ncbi:hypothetical protein H2201_001732 [Coniosporium apollinis]|uniref:SGNH hydrolase-type esterase domain-containing protein n=1 Tax=Coniosporium apollinis TaxID=61459 RepID=A0ABQ9P7G4_9PEZI|nr:hypothetical protein H2201_001732 [Coniosporium apollinis]
MRSVFQAGLVGLNFVARSIAAPALIPPPPLEILGSLPFKWAAIGDSWASGVTYALNGATDYDNNKDGCMRIKHAYSAQMSNDDTWTTGKQDMSFAACSGSKLVNMAVLNPQMPKTGDRPRIITMTAGGNDAGFFNVVINCVYQQYLLINYGPAYPDPNGLCAIAIKNATDYIERAAGSNPDVLGLSEDLAATLDDIFASNKIGDRESFRLYVTGYAHFFNAETDWCTAGSFGAFPLIGGQPKLSKELRIAINGLVEKFNRVYEKTIADYPDKRVRYVEVTQGFEGNRFCEEGKSHRDQYYSDDVWLWNLPPPYETDQTAEMDHYYTTRSAILDKEDPEDFSHVFDIFNDVKFESGVNGPGWMLRPFHPKEKGHAAIKDAIIAQARRDGVPGVKG